MIASIPIPVKRFQPVVAVASVSTYTVATFATAAWPPPPPPVLGSWGRGYEGAGSWDAPMIEPATWSMNEAWRFPLLTSAWLARISTLAFRFGWFDPPGVPPAAPPTSLGVSGVGLPTRFQSANAPSMRMFEGSVPP